MAVAGALIGGAIGAFGKKPKVPTLQEIRPEQVQADTIKGNVANFADIAKLAAQVNTFNQDQLNALIDRALGPGAREQIQKNIGSQLRGEVPRDVQNAIIRGRAERGYGALTGGSPFNANATAMDIGQTSLGITNNILSSAESWLAASKAPMMDTTKMFFTPDRWLAFSENQQNLKFQRDMIAAGVEAAPSPATAALGKEIDRFFNSFASVGMGMLGGQLAPDTGTFNTNTGGGVGGFQPNQSLMGSFNPYTSGGGMKL